MKRIAKEVMDNEVRYVYEVARKSQVSYVVFNSYKLFPNSLHSFGGWDMNRKCYTVTIGYPKKQ